jgi:hypothetical protein
MIGAYLLFAIRREGILQKVGTAYLPNFCAMVDTPAGKRLLAAAVD